jgi:predicted deacylase
MLSGNPIAPPSSQRVMLDRRSVLASAHGLCHVHFGTGDKVAQGEEVAEILDFYGDVRERLYSPIDGIVAQVFFQGATNPGNIVMKIARIED